MASTPKIDIAKLPVRSLKVTRFRELIVKSGLVGCTLFSIVITLSILLLLFFNSRDFFQFDGVSFSGFAFGTEWNPKLGAVKNFGIWPLVCGTMWVTVVAMAVAIPMGLITAVFLSEYAPRWLRNVLKPVLEVLAGVPTVVYGFFALMMLTPFLRDVIGVPLDFYNALSAGITVGILCIPTISSLSEDALQSVPNRLREAAYGLGGTRFDVAVKVVLPAAMSGIVSACLLAIARAIGETMIVAMAAGGTPNLTGNPLEEIQTMTGYITQTATGDISNFEIEYFSIYAVAATLFCITLTLTLLGHLIRQRYQEVYD